MSSKTTSAAPSLIVGIGASAGGLDAFAAFFRHLAPDTGMAFVVVQHLSPDYPSELARILQTSTKMKVQQVKKLVQLGPNCVYVIPPGKLMSVLDGHLDLREPSPMERRSLIDHFFRTLGEEQGDRAVGVVLSGMGADGSIGLKTLKEYGGFTMAQEPSEASFDSMPRSAIGTGLVDVVGPVETLARTLQALPTRVRRTQKLADGQVTDGEEDTLRRLFVLLRGRTGHDFSQYKRSTILRRIRRRMQATEIDALPEFLDYARANENEAEQLVKDFLISVTSFFRDPEAFEALGDLVVAPLVERAGQETIRVWVPGCATGEEAYSLAMLFLERLEQADRPVDLQIFATDIDPAAITAAREGLYPKSIVGDVSAARLARFFVEEANGYRLVPEVHERVLVASHNVIKDPPFSRLDLVSCRNLLIYLNRDLQDRVFGVFHYALRHEGALFLGGSESAEGQASLFQTLDKRARIYRRTDVPERVPHLLPSEGGPRLHAPERPAPVRSSVSRLHQGLLLQFAPASVLVTQGYEVRHVHGDLGPYLRPAPGDPSHHLLQMAPAPLRLDLRVAMLQAFREGVPAEMLSRDAGGQPVRVRVQPVPSPDPGGEALALITFEPTLVAAAPTLPLATPGGDGAPSDGALAQLEAELDRLRQQMQVSLEEFEISSEELRASNEELQSMNEETRSMAEELETSKEELQSTNEELTTVNQELSTKIEELSRANSDLLNLMHATDIGTLFLDRTLALKRYTPRTTELFHIIPSDLGRPFEHVSHKIEYDGLAGDARRVLQRLEPVRTELKGKNGRWYLVHLLPYRTVEDRIDGVVLTFLDITERREEEERSARRARQQALVAELGEFDLRTASFADLTDLAVRHVAQALDVPLAKVLCFEPGPRQFHLIAGVGWHDGLVGEAKVSGGRQSQAGFTFTTDHPVIVTNLATERRFNGPALLFDHGVVSGISVTIPGTGDHPYGVLGAHDTAAHPFSDLDVAFMQSVANVIGAAVERYRVEEALRLSEVRFRTALDGAPITVAHQDPAHRYTWIYNPVSRPEAAIIGRTDAELLERPEDAARMHVLKQRVMETGKPLRERLAFLIDGEDRYFWLNIEPLHDPHGNVTGVLSAALDVTDLTQTAQALRAASEVLEQRVRARTAEVEQQAAQLRTLASDLTLAEQRERQRVAQVLHDDLQQLLYSLQIKLAVARKNLPEDLPNLHKVVTRFSELLGQAIDTTRSLAVDLSPPVLAGEGVAQALHWLALQMEELHGLRVEVEAEGPGVVGSHELQVLLFQLVRELLFNTVKHAGVQQARVVLREHPDTLEVQVLDAGKGFAPDRITRKVNGSFGLYSVRERIELFGGTFSIGGAPGGGTLATIVLPRTLPAS